MSDAPKHKQGGIVPEPHSVSYVDWLTMRNIARRFQKNWRLVEDPELGWCWRQVVGGRKIQERPLPGEVETVHDVLDQMGW